MKLQELKTKLREVLYIEDEGVIDIILASIISNSIAKTDPVWLMLVGPSSGGKSQLLRPFAVANPDFIHRVDDLTENSLISGQKTEEISILAKIKERGIILISDFTVIFSKSPETRNAILSQLRMVFDGEYTRHFGNRAPYTWKGHLGIIAGATPSVYNRMSEVADMGERFIYYRLKPYDQKKAMDKVKKNTLTAREIDEVVSESYEGYIKAVVNTFNESSESIVVEESVNDMLSEIASYCTQLRTPVHLDYKGLVDEIPVQEASFRVFKQLKALAHSLTAMQFNENGKTSLSKDKIEALQWTAYSLGSEERRKMVKAILETEQAQVTIKDIASYVGLELEPTEKYLSQLTAIGICKMHGSLDEISSTTKRYSISNPDFEKFVSGIEFSSDDVEEGSIEEDIISKLEG